MGVDGDEDDRPYIVAEVMRAAANTAWERWVAKGGPGDPSEQIDAALRLVRRGLGRLETRPAGRHEELA